MRTRRFGASNIQVPIVGQGTWPTPDVAALRHGIARGLTHIDTAEMYGNGRSEELVGEALRGVPREQIFLVSKVLPANGRPGDLARSCEASLRRLGVAELDCYLLHWRGDVDLAETIGGMAELVRAGKTRFIGVSNLDPWDLREALAVQSEFPLVCNQLYYHLGERTIEDHEYPYAQEHDQAVVAYTPLGGIPTAGRARALLDELAVTYGAGVHAIALAFLLRLPQLFVIPKASQIMHVDDNARAAEILLSAEDLARLDAAFPKRQRLGPLPMN